MVLSKDFKKFLETELQDSKSTWIASAMISKSGWNFLQSNIPSTTNQHYLIGIDLSTEPMVFKLLLNRVDIHARIYECAYTFHPKVYIIQKNNNELIAFIGSSNTTAGGLENNVEMNFQINDQIECKTLIKWFDQLYDNGQIISEEFLEEYKTSFAKSYKK
jgi:HKD family nuclease